MMDDHYLQKYAIGPIPDSLVKQYVARFVDQEGAWNWGLFASFYQIIFFSRLRVQCDLVSVELRTVVFGVHQSLVVSL